MGLLSLLLMLFLLSCTENSQDENENKLPQETVFLSFVSDGQDIIHPLYGSGEITIDVGRVYYTSAASNYRQGKIEAVIGIDYALADKYNVDKKAAYKKLPETACALENQRASISDGSGRSNMVKLVVKSGDLQIEKNVVYIVPITIQHITAAENIQIGTDKTVYLLFRLIDCSNLTPKYVPNGQVTIESDGSPDWVKHLMMSSMRIQTATNAGTLDAAVKVLDHYQSIGVNGIWINPVYDPGANGNGYSNLGTHTIDPAITGTTDYRKGWEKLADFINEAHNRNIRIFLDIITWGTVLGSDLKKEYPAWFSGSAWGGDAFNWSNPEFSEWFIQQAVNIAVVSGCDGFRFDCEPEFAGYEVVRQIRDRLLAQGHKPVMMSEATNERKGVYILEQRAIDDWLTYYRTQGVPPYTFIDKYNMVDFIKSGQLGGEGMYRFYTNNITNHDNIDPVIWGNRLVMGYQVIFSPFIPMWYIGEEWNNPHNGLNTNDNVLYFNKIDWSALEKNRHFFEDIKAMLLMRRQYPEIFTYFPEHHKEINICKVTVNGGDIQAYARYAGNKAILVIPDNKSHSEMTVTIPFAETGLGGYSHYTVTDLNIECVLVEGTASATGILKIKAPNTGVRILKVEGR